MGLNSKQSRHLVALMKDYDLIQAELRALSAILRRCEEISLAPVAWIDTLKEIRKTPEYRSIAERHSEMFARIEDAADVTEAEVLLQTIPSAQIPN